MCILWLFSNPIFHYTAGEAASWIHIERGMLEFVMWGFYCLNKDPSVYVKEIIPCYLFIYSYAMFLLLTLMVHKDADELCLSNGANSFCLTLGFFCLNYENSSLEKSQIKEKTPSLFFFLPFCCTWSSKHRQVPDYAWLNHRSMSFAKENHWNFWAQR